MEANRPSRASTRSRAVALLLTCALALAVGVIGRGASGHKHLSRGVASIALVTADHPATGHRNDSAAAIPGPAASTTLPRTGYATADTSAPVSSTTAQSPPVRGPPVEAAV